MGGKLSSMTRPGRKISDDPDGPDSLDGIDFIDFGASNGHSLRWAETTFGKTGLGIDIDPAKVASARGAGLRAIVADAAALDLPDASVGFAIVNDFLEHLGTVDVARAVVRSAIRVARDFVFIAYPDFDNERLLLEQGLKRYYADWSGHNLHLRSQELAEIVAESGAPFELFKLQEIFDSFDRNVLPQSAPRNSSYYDPALHEPKPFVLFPRKTFYARNICLISKSNLYPREMLLTRILYTIGYMRRVAGSEAAPV